MSTTEAEIDKLKHEIENYLKINNREDFYAKVENNVKKFQKYPQHVKDYRKYIGKAYENTERMEKLKQKIDILNSQNEKSLQNIENSRNKILDLKEHITKLESELENKKQLMENIDDSFDFLGLRIYNKSDALYTIQLSKLPIKDYDRTFSFDISHVDNNIECKFEKYGSRKLYRHQPNHARN
ncbi:hypothetical protein BLA29_003502 [Euroglyphus maynei]|uniref:Kinetochore protein SPC25 n=1 Tax=Euroglyphus maynei TaxID=6958 RepID=A0A1Y3B9U0_EURMA|nr:hypothetical protein BLA29_003502 [Euroglyphus maynei]